MEADVLKAKLEEVQSEFETMQEFLESRASDTPELMLERLTQINSYLARSGMLLADIHEQAAFGALPGGRIKR